MLPCNPPYRAGEPGDWEVDQSKKGVNATHIKRRLKAKQNQRIGGKRIKNSGVNVRTLLYPPPLAICFVDLLDQKGPSERRLCFASFETSSAADGNCSPASSTRQVLLEHVTGPCWSPYWRCWYNLMYIKLVRLLICSVLSLVSLVHISVFVRTSQSPPFTHRPAQAGGALHWWWWPPA